MTVRCVVDGKPWSRRVIFAGGLAGTTVCGFHNSDSSRQAGRATIRLSRRARGT